MIIWLITLGEFIPIDGANIKLMRTGTLANVLAEKGHDVVIWTSTFNHAQKIRRFNKETTLSLTNHIKYIFLHSVSYKKNISLRRLLNHYLIGRKFKARVAFEPEPDIIVCSFPTIELSHAATQYGRQKNVPVILDVRDLWPDIFLYVTPDILRKPARLLLSGFYKQAQSAFMGAYAITAVSEKYLDFGLKYAERAKSDKDRVFPIGYRDTEVPDEAINRAMNRLDALGVNSNKLICWFVGTFAKTYDLTTVIEGARRLSLEGDEDIQFVFSGDGERYSEWYNRAKSLRNVIFTGWIDLPQTNYLRRTAGIGLMAYAKGAPQGLPNKLFEYLSAGIPILSSLQGETEEILSKYQCGLTYIPADASSFVNILKMIKQDSALRNRLGSNALSIFKTLYDGNVIYQNMANYVVEIMKNHLVSERHLPGIAYDEQI